jgi:hypothetical protein
VPSSYCCPPALFNGLVFQDDFVPSKATPEVKEKFFKAVVACVFFPMITACLLLTQYNVVQVTIIEEDTGCGTTIYAGREGIGGFRVWLRFSLHVI